MYHRNSHFDLRDERKHKKQWREETWLSLRTEWAVLLHKPLQSTTYLLKLSTFDKKLRNLFLTCFQLLFSLKNLLFPFCSPNSYSTLRKMNTYRLWLPSIIYASLSVGWITFLRQDYMILIAVLLCLNWKGQEFLFLILYRFLGNCYAYQ